MKKADIEAEKTDIEEKKEDIKEEFKTKTVSQIRSLREAFPGQSVFGRSDVMAVIGIKKSRASELLRKMLEAGVIEPVKGQGKGKYRFR